MYPESFEKLVEYFAKLPGVGNKTAQRYVFSLLKDNRVDNDEFAQALKSLKNIKRCSRCGFLADDDLCVICRQERDHKQIMVVSYDQDIEAMENTGVYNGYYHVLGGVISASKGIYPDELNIDSLLDRLEGVQEIIIATPFTVEGEMTAMYLDRLLKKSGIYTSRLAQGLPMGASLDYADEWTLKQAMDNRQEIKDENE